MLLLLLMTNVHLIHPLLWIVSPLLLVCGIHSLQPAHCVSFVPVATSEKIFATFSTNRLLVFIAML